MPGGNLQDFSLSRAAGEILVRFKLALPSQHHAGSCARREAYSGTLIPLPLEGQVYGDWFCRVRPLGQGDDRSLWSTVQTAFVRAFVWLPLIIRR